MSSIVPGRRVRGSRSGRPIMVLLDLMGRRMAVIATPAGNLAALEAKARVEQVTFPDLKRGTDLSPLISNRTQWGSMRVPH